MKKIITLLILLLIGISSTFASTGLNVVLANQNPDPVAPGNFVFVNVNVANSGSSPIRDASIDFIENEFFSLAPGEDITKNLGTIPAFSTLSSSSLTIAKYKLLVDPETPLGLNTINFEVDNGVNTLEFDFEILVQDANPTIELVSSKLSDEFIKAGENQELQLEFVNKNNIDLKDVIITLDLENVESQVLSTKSGSNQIFLDTLIAGESSTVVTNLIATPDADSKPYLLPITIEYEDSLGNSYIKSVVSSVQIYSVPELTLELDSQDTYTTGTGRYTLSIANPSPTTAKGVELRIISQDTYEVLEGSFQYVGDLDPDDFQTFQSDVFVSDLGANLLVELSYLDAYNNKIEESRSLDLQLYDEVRLQELGLSSSNGGGSSLVSTVVIIIIGIVIGYFIGRRQASKKRRN